MLSVQQSARGSRRLLFATIAAILLLTLTPISGPEETVSTLCILCGTYGTADFILNVLMFVPLGYLLARVINSENRALVFVVSFTVMIELVQVLIPGRYPTLGDVVANIVGGSLGIWTMHVRSLGPIAQPHRGQQAAARVAPFGLALALVLTVVLLKPALPDTSYYGQWTADLGQFAQYDGRIRSVRVGTVDLPSHRLDVVATGAVHRMAEGEAPLLVEFLAGPRTSSLAPVFSVFDENQVEVLVVGVESEAIVVRLRRLAETLGLHAPPVRFEHFHPPAGSELTLRLRREPRSLCIRLDGMDSCRVLATPARGWSLFAGIPLPVWAPGFLDAMWLALLGFVTVTFGVRNATWYLPVFTYCAMWLLLGGDPTWVPGLAGLIAGSAGASSLRRAQTAVVS